VTPVQAIEEPESPKQWERKAAYYRKVNKGFEYLNGKLAIMAPKEDPVANSMLENQMQMYKQLLDVERLLRVSKEKKDKANEERVAAMRKIDRLNQEMQKLLEEKARTFKDHSAETGQLKGKVTTLEDEVKSLKGKLWKATKSDESSKVQLNAAKQTIEDLKRENANLRSQLGTDYTIAYQSEGGSPLSDETPRRQLQSQGSIESRLDEGFDVILKVTQAITGHSYANISSLLDKQKAVYDEVMALTSAKSAVSQETSMLLTTCNDDLAKAREQIAQMAAQISSLLEKHTSLSVSIPTVYDLAKQMEVALQN
jgi:chromosome segregation ATPase